MTRSNATWTLACWALLATGLGACDHEGTYTCLRFAAEVGDTCGPDLDCVDEASCVEGVCTPRGDLGDACDSEIGPACRGPYACVAGACVGHQIAEGRECDPGDEAACEEGLACVRDRHEHRCHPLVEAGEACAADAQCPADLLCVGRVCGAAPGYDEGCTPDNGCAEGLSCVRLENYDVCRPTPDAEGDLCGWPDLCPDGLDCVQVGDFSRRCMAELPRGSACELSDRTPRCEAGSYCSHETDVCEPIGAHGDLCSSSYRDDSESCREGLACQPANDGHHRCLPPVGEGESCREGQTCGSNTFCDRDRAAPEPSFSLAP